MILAFGKHIGKSTEEIDSYYLVWVIESYEYANQALIVACKSELSSRLKLDFSPIDTEKESLKKKLITCYQNEKLLIMNNICKANPIIMEGYLNNPEKLNADFELIKVLAKTTY